MKGKWKFAAICLLILQLLISAAAIGFAIRLNALPTMYIGWAIGAFTILFAISALLLLLPERKNAKRRIQLYVRRGIGCGLALVTCVAGVFGCYSIAVLHQTLQNISSVNEGEDGKTVTLKKITSVYVLAEDPAEEIGDVLEYTFGVTESYDWEHTLLVINKVQDAFDVELDLNYYDSVPDMVDALYEGEISAMVMNTAFVDILEDQEEYADFKTLTKAVYESTEEIVEKMDQNTINETEEPFALYISGSDTRSKTLAQSRSDVNIVAFVNPQTHQILLVNTPRDFYVDISISPGSKDKLTHCGLYGVQCSMDTLGGLYDVSIDHYAQINFTGFETLIDAIGGVTVESEKSFYTREGGYYISKGANLMSGKVALAFCRDRYAFSDGDLARGRHQMAVIAAMIGKLSNSSTIVRNYTSIMNSIDGMFETDLTSAEISGLIKMQLSDNMQWNVKLYTVTGEGASRTTYSVPNSRAYVMIPDEDSVEHAKALIQKIYNNEILTDGDVEE